jgi:hypothetical protein
MMKRVLLLASWVAFAGCGAEDLPKKAGGPSGAKDLCTWLKDNDKLEKDGNADWTPVQVGTSSMRIQAACAGSQVIDIVLHQSASGSYDPERDLKITLRQDSPKGGSFVYRSYKSYGYDVITEKTTRLALNDVEVMENGSNELSIRFKSAGSLKESDGKKVIERKLDFEANLSLYLRGKKSATLVQKSADDHDYLTRTELNFTIEEK